MIKKKFIKLICILLFGILLLPLCYSLAKTIPLIGAQYLHDAGIAGKYQTICLLDTGIDYTNPYLGGCTSDSFLSGQCPTIIGGYDFGDDDNNPIYNAESTIPKGYHGTMLALLLLSSHDELRGIVYESNIVAVKHINDDSKELDKDYIMPNISVGIDWCISNKESYNISVIIITAGYLQYSGLSCDDQFGLQQKINNANENDIAVFAASGQGGKLSIMMPGIVYPACLENVTSVAASDFNDEIWSNSFRGSALDLLAPGYQIEFPGLGIPKCDVGPCKSDGTSLATPFAAGSYILIKEYDPALSPFDIEKLLKDTGKPIGSNQYPRIDLAAALNILDWPTYHHDYRRTGFTLLKGDLTEDKLEKNSHSMQSTSSAMYDRPSISDLNDNCKMDVVAAIKTGDDESKLYRFEDNKEYTIENGMCKAITSEGTNKWKQIWVKKFNGIIMGNPTLEDVRSTNNKEILMAVEGGKVYALNINGKVRKSYGNVPSDAIVGHISAYDIDLDGEKEIIFTSYMTNGQGQLYILDGSSFKDKYSSPIDIGFVGINGKGTYGPVSIANIDNDHYPEIIIPSVHGIFVFEFNGSTIAENTSLRDYNSYIPYSVVVSDIDKDKKYEFVYITNNISSSCPDSSCENVLRVRKSESNEDDHSVGLNVWPLSTPVVADINSDYDGQEIVFAARTYSESDPDGKIFAYGLGENGYEKIWEYPSSGTIDLTYTGVDAADIDPESDGIEIIYGGAGGKIYVLSKDGSLLYDYSLGGTIASAPAIGDWDGDGMAEIVVKHYTTGGGSFLSLNGTPIQYPVARYEPGYEYTWNHGLIPMASYTGQIAVVSGQNRMPVLTPIDEVIIIEGDYVNLSVDATDYNNDTLTYSFSEPLNDSGFWQTYPHNTSGEYQLLVSVSDGNLSDSQYVDLTVLRHDANELGGFNLGGVYL